MISPWSVWKKICSAHRSADGTAQGAVAEFFLPRLTRGFFLRMTVVAALSAVIFGWVLIPCVIDGASMVPTYPDRGFTFCWRGRYLWSAPQRGDVVIVKFHDRVFFLKRIVALPGDTVEFRRGILFLNGVAQHEPYVRYASDWEIRPHTVEPGHYYVVGDNRSQPQEAHRFGQVRASRIIGAPLF